VATNPMALSADDVFYLEVPDNLLGYELVDGQLVEISVPGPTHGWIAGRLTQRLLNHIDAHGPPGGIYIETGYVLGLRRDPERLRLPDLSYVSDATLKARREGLPDGWFHLIADFVVEIDSPGTRPAINRERIRDFLDAGVKLIWVIHTKRRTATVHHADGTTERLDFDDVLAGDPVLPGLRIPLAELFPPT
jgi:Uma2 family endonuclease